eukprot:scaffold7344_cov145-Cylindrotheca_fusiformis.AAC.8
MGAAFKGIQGNGMAVGFEAPWWDFIGISMGFVTRVETDPWLCDMGMIETALHQTKATDAAVGVAVAD